MSFPSVGIAVNSVRPKQWTGWGQDAAGGRVPIFGDPADPVQCSVQATSAKDVPLHLRQSEVVYYSVFFWSDQGLHIRDQLIWVEGGNVILTVTGYYPPAGRLVLWKATCEQRPLK